MKPEKQLYQWDINQYLTELQPTAQFVDYPIGNEVIRIQADGNRCRIPDEVLQTYGGKTCYERYPDGTFRAYSFSVLYAPKPPDYVYTPEERTTFESLTARVDAAIDDIKRRADSGEFTPKKGVDYFTEEDKDELMESVSSGAVGEFREVVDSATAEYNANATEKLTTYDTNAEQHTTDYNRNAAEKLKAYNDNHTEKMTAYDTNATEKLTTYDTNAEQHTTDYNRNAAEKLEAYNRNHTAKVAEYNQNAETKTAEFDSNAAALQTEVDRLRGECDTLAAENRKQENRIDALIKLNKGQTYDILPEEGETASRTAPSGAKYVGINMVGGKSVVWNQLVNGDGHNQNITFLNGKFTYSDYASGVWILNTNLTLTSGHKYYAKASKPFNNVYVLCYTKDTAHRLFEVGNVNTDEVVLDTIVTCDYTANDYRLYVSRYGATSDTPVSNYEGYIMLFDLTQMFGSTIADYIYSLEQATAGAGVAWFKRLFHADYYPYSEPTIISSQTDMVDVANADGRTSQQITTSFPVLNSAGSAYDYIDLNDGKLHQRVGIVDLGTLDWRTVSNAYMESLAAPQGIKSVAEIETANVICPLYQPIALQPMRVSDDKRLAVKPDGKIFVRDSAYTDATAFKAAMNGVMLYYELAEEVITDIEIPTELTDWLTVEAGGSITFHNADESKQLAVPNSVSWVRKLDEVN